MLHFELVMSINLALGAENIDEMLLLRFGALHYAKSLLVGPEIPDVRMHIEYGIILRRAIE